MKMVINIYIDLGQWQLSSFWQNFDININEPRREKTGFMPYAKTKTQISFAVTAKLISAFVFATRIVQFLYFLNPKFQASGRLLLLHSPVCVGPGRKPRRPVFSERGSNNLSLWSFAVSNL